MSNRVNDFYRLYHCQSHVTQKDSHLTATVFLFWLRKAHSNLRPPGYEETRQVLLCVISSNFMQKIRILPTFNTHFID